MCPALRMPLFMEDVLFYIQIATSCRGWGIFSVCDVSLEEDGFATSA